MRSGLALIVSCLLVCPPGLVAAPAEGVVQGTVTLDGRPLSGMELSLVDVLSGVIHTTRSDAAGAYELSLRPGSYVVTGRSAAGVTVVADSATAIDADARQVKLSRGGALDYDRLVISPGVGFKTHTESGPGSDDHQNCQKTLGDHGTVPHGKRIFFIAWASTCLTRSAEMPNSSAS